MRERNLVLELLRQVAQAGMSERVGLERVLAVDRSVLQLMLDQLVQRRWLAEIGEGAGPAAAGRLAGCAVGCIGCPLNAGRSGPGGSGGLDTPVGLPTARRYLLTPAGRRALQAMERALDRPLATKPP